MCSLPLNDCFIFTVPFITAHSPEWTKQTLAVGRTCRRVCSWMQSATSLLDDTNLWSSVTSSRYSISVWFHFGEF